MAERTDRELLVLACRRCGGPMKPGLAMGQAFRSGSPDFIGGQVVTMSAGCPGKHPEVIMETLFYVQDSRQFVGNDMIWWRPEGKGYTTDMREAGTFTRDEAQRMHNHRPSDVPWPKDYIDAKTRPAVDVQYVKRDEALAGTGIVLVPPPERRREALKCLACGCFMSEPQLWAGRCPKCGADNRP